MRNHVQVAVIGGEAFTGFERAVLLQTIDSHWREHLSSLDHLRQGIHLRGYAQKQPKQEYKREAFELFGQMLDSIKNEVTRLLMTVRLQSSAQVEGAAEEMITDSVHNISYSAPNEDGEAETMIDPATLVAAMPVGRNDPCPCGSGKKFKQCHGKLA